LKKVSTDTLVKLSQKEPSRKMSTYYASFTDNGSGLFTVALQRTGVAPSGGTALPGGGANLLSGVSTTQLGVAIEAAKVVAENDRAAGN
jgi:hypothetical protein